MASYFDNSLYRAMFVSFEILALLSSTGLWICKILGINTKVSGIHHDLLHILHEVDGKLSGCVH